MKRRMRRNDDTRPHSDPEIDPTKGDFRVEIIHHDQDYTQEVLCHEVDECLDVVEAEFYKKNDAISFNMYHSTGRGWKLVRQWTTIDGKLIWVPVMGQPSFIAKGMVVKSKPRLA